jgi:hypothetical protein
MGSLADIFQGHKVGTFAGSFLSSFYDILWAVSWPNLKVFNNIHWQVNDTLPTTNTLTL